MAERAMGAALVMHGGGPTAVLNASLAGVVEECRGRSEIGGIYGALDGVEGLLAGHWVDLAAEDTAHWDEIARTPGSALGTSRRKVGPEDYARMLDLLRRRGVRYLLANGGNGTMEMAGELSAAAEASGSGVAVIGIPKTIDNDIEGTDHTPGYGSAARFFAGALRDIGADNRALPGVTVVEILGRNAGWLAAATLLARQSEDDAPHLVYFPERRLPLETLLRDVERVYGKRGRAVVAVCEGQLDERGEPFGADVRASSRAPLALNLAHVLSKRIAAALKLAARSEKPGLLGRSCGEMASETDRAEARACGRAAVRAALDGHSGAMVTLERAPGEPYEASTGLRPLREVAGRERLFPSEWIPDAAEADIPAFRHWAAPLVGEIRKHGRLRMVPVF